MLSASPPRGPTRGCTLLLCFFWPSALWECRLRVVVITSANDLLSVDRDGPCAGKVHRLDDHHLEIVIRGVRSVYVEQEVLPLDEAAVGEINAEIALDAEL